MSIFERCLTSLFGFESGAALATVVGVLIEVPVMLSVVYLVKRSQKRYEPGVQRWIKRCAIPAEARGAGEYRIKLGLSIRKIGSEKAVRGVPSKGRPWL